MPDYNYFKLGLFTLAGFFLLTGGLFIFGLREKIGSEQVECATLFNRSVQGLSEDSPVKFRGFTVGRVTAISLASVNDRTGQPLVRVRFTINPDTLAAQIEKGGNIYNYLNREIERGLKVYLTLQGVTGTCFLDLDYSLDPPAAGSPIDLIHWQELENLRQVVYIPNGPSKIVEIGESVSRLVKSLNDIDFVSLNLNLKNVLATVDRLMINLETSGLTNNLNSALAEIKNAGNAMSHLAGKGSGSLSQELGNSARQMRQFLKRLDQIMGSSQGALPLTLNNLQTISDNLRELSELLKNQPSQIIFGQPPARVDPNQDRERKRP